VPLRVVFTLQEVRASGRFLTPTDTDRTKRSLDRDVEEETSECPTQCREERRTKLPQAFNRYMQVKMPSVSICGDGADMRPISVGQKYITFNGT
jgi:hypothetical protein